MKKITAVQARDDHRVWMRFEDGVEGEVNLSHLVGVGVFRIWRDPQRFQQVRVGEFGELSWGEDVDLCPDSLYLQVTGRAAEEVFEARAAATHA